MDSKKSILTEHANCIKNCNPGMTHKESIQVAIDIRLGKNWKNRKRTEAEEIARAKMINDAKK